MNGVISPRRFSRSYFLARNRMLLVLPEYRCPSHLFSREFFVLSSLRTRRPSLICYSPVFMSVRIACSLASNVTPIWLQQACLLTFQESLPLVFCPSQKIKWSFWNLFSLHLDSQYSGVKISSGKKWFFFHWPIFHLLILFEPRHKKNVRTTKAQISLRIRAVLSASLLFAA